MRKIYHIRKIIANLPHYNYLARLIYGFPIQFLLYLQMKKKIYRLVLNIKPYSHI